MAKVHPQDVCTAPECPEHVPNVANEGSGAIHSELLPVNDFDITGPVE